MTMTVLEFWIIAIGLAVMFRTGFVLGVYAERHATPQKAKRGER
jgi:hypothetical protein